MNSGDDKTHSGKTKKRTIKTPAQVEALERFYDDHKYPSESMKSQLAESIGLTEKQVSGWFCHCRLKDKRLSSGEVSLNGKQERSSGIIQDRGSGFRQDSCGSAKQGDDRTSDPREVESRRLNGAEFSTPDLTHDFGGHLARNHNGMDDTSLGSNSSLRNAHFPLNAESFDEGNSRYLTNSCPADMPVKPRTGPSGYLKVKGHVENAAIFAVKGQLGRQYREDGPPLGVEFEPLPPRAFESSVQNDPNKHEAARSEDFPEVHRQQNSSTAYEYYSKIRSHNLDTSSERFKRVHGTDGRGIYVDQKFRKKTVLPIPEYSVSARNSQGEEDEGPAREMLFNSRDNDKPLAKRIEASFEVSEVQHSEFKPSSVHYHDVREKEISRSVKKDDLFSRDGRMLDEGFNQGQLKIPGNFETMDVKRISNYMSSPEFARNVQLIGIQTIHQGGRSAVETTSSSSEDDDSSTESSSFEE